MFLLRAQNLCLIERKKLEGFFFELLIVRTNPLVWGLRIYEFYYKCLPLFKTPGPEVLKLFSYSTQLSTKFIMLINVKMPTSVGILTFISMINTTS